MLGGGCPASLLSDNGLQFCSKLRLGCALITVDRSACWNRDTLALYRTCHGTRVRAEGRLFISVIRSRVVERHDDAYTAGRPARLTRTGRTAVSEQETTQGEKTNFDLAVWETRARKRCACWLLRQVHLRPAARPIGTRYFKQRRHRVGPE